jgi:hypothetical protein
VSKRQGGGPSDERKKISPQGRRTAVALTGQSERFTDLPAESWHLDAPPPIDSRRSAPPQRVPFSLDELPTWEPGALAIRAGQALDELVKKFQGAQGYTLGVTYWDGERVRAGEKVTYTGGPFVQSMAWRSSVEAAKASFTDYSRNLASGVYHIGASREGACYFLTCFATIFGADLQERKPFKPRRDKLGRFAAKPKRKARRSKKSKRTAAAGRGRKIGKRRMKSKATRGSGRRGTR